MNKINELILFLLPRFVSHQINGVHCIDGSIDIFDPDIESIPCDFSATAHSIEWLGFGITYCLSEIKTA